MAVIRLFAVKQSSSTGIITIQLNGGFQMLNLAGIINIVYAFCSLDRSCL